MKTVHLKIAGRDFALAFTLDAMADMAESIKSFDIETLTDHVKSPRDLVTIIYCLARQGELLEGRKLDVDRDWFGCHLSPHPRQAFRVQTAAFEALAEGLKMETEEDDPDEEKDVALEEIKKKETNIN